MRDVHCALAFGGLLPAAAAGNANRGAGSLVALVRPSAHSGPDQGLDDAVGACGFDVVDRAGQGGEACGNQPKGRR
jgi:hypothetical protein